MHVDTNCLPPPPLQGILQDLLPDVEVEEAKDYEEWLEVFVQEVSKNSSVTNGPSTPSPDSSVSVACTSLKHAHTYRYSTSAHTCQSANAAMGLYTIIAFVLVPVLCTDVHTHALHLCT